MPYRTHSGFVVVVCPDWAYHAHWLKVLGAGEQVMPPEDSDPRSRLGMLVKRVLDDPRNTSGVPPHIIRTEAPAHMVGHVEQQYAFVGANMTVLKGAHTVFLDGHSDCAGIANRCHGRFSTDQRDLQTGFIRSGLQRFANLLAVNGSQEVMVIAEYPQFDNTGKVLEVFEIDTAKASAPASHN